MALITIFLTMVSTLVATVAGLSMEPFVGLLTLFCVGPTIFAGINQQVIPISVDHWARRWLFGFSADPSTVPVSPFLVVSAAALGLAILYVQVAIGFRHFIVTVPKNMRHDAQVRESLLISLALSLNEVHANALDFDSSTKAGLLLDTIDEARKSLESLCLDGRRDEGFLRHIKARLDHDSDIMWDAFDENLKPGLFCHAEANALVGDLRLSVPRWLAEAFKDQVLDEWVVLRQWLPRNGLEVRTDNGATVAKLGTAVGEQEKA